MNSAQVIQITGLESGLQVLASALVLNAREDGSTYRTVSDALPDWVRRNLLEVIWDAHNEELPNDWRYEMVHRLADAFLMYSQPQPQPWALEDFADAIGEIADACTDISTSALLGWLADHPGRCCFGDPETACSDIDGSDIADLARRRQTEEIAWMATVILEGINAMVQPE